MIVVTSPTGLIGRQVLQNLLGADHAVRVIARDPHRLSPGTRARVEVIQGSHGDPAVVEEAFDGADSVFWLVPPDPQAASVEAAYVDFSRPASEALAGQSDKHVVAISALGRGLPLDAGHVTASLAVDDLMAGSGVSYRSLTMPSFMDNIARQTALIASQGMFTSPISGDRKVPTCAEDHHPRPAHPSGPRGNVPHADRVTCLDVERAVGKACHWHVRT